MNIPGNNALVLIRNERAKGNLPSELASKAENLVERLQTEVVEFSKTAPRGDYFIAPCWSGSSHRTQIKFDPACRPSETAPLQGVEEFLDSDHVFGKWGQDIERTYKASDSKAVFQETYNQVPGLSVTVNANGTITVDPGKPAEDKWAYSLD